MQCFKYFPQKHFFCLKDAAGNIYLFSLLQISNSKTYQLTSVFADNNNYIYQNDN